MWKARRGVLTPVASRGASAAAWTPASLDGTVRYFSARLSVTESGGVVSAVPDLNGGGNWAPAGGGSDLAYSATSFTGSTPGITSTGGKGINLTSLSTSSTSVWFFFCYCYIDSATTTGIKVFSIAPNGGFQDFGNDGASVVTSGLTVNVGVTGLQDGNPVAAGLASYDAYHRIGYVCSGSTETVYVDGVAATAPGGGSNPATPPSAPHTLNATIAAAFFTRADGGGSNGAIGKFQSGIFKFGGTAPDATTLTNIDNWLQSPV